MTPLSGLLAAVLPAPPLGAVVSGILLVAIPTIVLMAVWSVVTMVRILFPERPLPFDPAARRDRARHRGESRPVRLRDILDDQRRRPSGPVLPSARAVAETGSPPPVPGTGDPLFDDLWLRRN